MRSAQVASTRRTCANGHPMLNGQKFCPDRDTLGVSTTPPPPQSADHPAADRPTQADIPFVLLVVGAVVALIVAFVLMFTTPHATFDGNVNDGGNVAQGTISTSCITAWTTWSATSAIHRCHPVLMRCITMTLRIALVLASSMDGNTWRFFLSRCSWFGHRCVVSLPCQSSPGCNCESAITSAHQAVGASYSDRVLGADFSSSSAVTMSGNRQSKDRYGS